MLLIQMWIVNYFRWSSRHYILGNTVWILCIIRGCHVTRQGMWDSIWNTEQRLYTVTLESYLPHGYHKCSCYWCPTNSFVVYFYTQSALMHLKWWKHVLIEQAQLTILLRQSAALQISGTSPFFVNTVLIFLVLHTSNMSSIICGPPPVWVSLNLGTPCSLQHNHI